MFQVQEHTSTMNSTNCGDQLPLNPVEKFEETFQSCLSAITKEDTLTNVDKEEIKVDAEHSIQNFVEQARSLEAYFLKKRLHIAAQKPELLIKDDVSELRLEVMRKEELIKRNCDKIHHWMSILADLQSPGKAPPPSVGGSSGNVTPSSSAGPSTPLGKSPGPGRPQTPGSVGPPSGRMGFHSPASQHHNASGLQGPLAYLEKTTSGIGINDNRP